jgi:hypothetical protein
MELSDTPVAAPPPHPLRRRTDHIDPHHPASLVLDCCAACKFFLVDPAGVDAGAAAAAAAAGAGAGAGMGQAMLGHADHAARTTGAHPHARRRHDSPGECRRYPASLRKTEKDWCGEFVRKPQR